MSITDANRRQRPGMFEVVTDPTSGATFTPTSGRGNKTQFSVNGTDDTIIARGANPDELRWKAESQGIIAPQPSIWPEPTRLGKKL